MISARFLNLSSFFAIVLFGCLSAAMAQDAGYTPPPMFEDLTPPMVRPETTTGNIVEPRASTRESIEPSAPVTTTTTTSPVPHEPVVAPQAPQPAVKGTTANIVKPVSKPLPPQKPAMKKPDIQHPVITPVRKPEDKTASKATEGAEKQSVNKSSAPVQPVAPTAPVAPAAQKEKPPVAKAAPKKEVITKAAPAPVSKPAVKPKAPTRKAAAEEPRTAPVKRDPKQSAIKGPKTMPALPTTSVEVEKTFESDEGAVEAETMLQRQQNEDAAPKKVEETYKAPAVPAPKTNVAPARFARNDEGVLKKTIPFRQGQIGLSSEDIDPVAVTVNTELDADGHEEWRVQIRSYATPYGTGVSSDKRIALSRALSLRTALIAQGVPAARIDVLAEGQSGENGKQPDRIDIYLYGPAQE